MKDPLLKKFIKNNIIILILVNSSSIFNYLFQLVIGRSLTPIDYGIFNSLLALGAFISSPCSIIHIVFSRFIVKLSVSGLGHIKSLLIKSLKGALSIGCGLCCLGLISIPWIKEYFHLKDTTPVIIMLAGISIAFVAPLLFAMLEGLHRFTLFGLGSFSYTVSRFLGVLVLVALLGWGVEGAFLALFIASGISIIYGLFCLKDVFKSKSEDLPHNTFGEMGYYFIPVFFSTLMIMIMGNFDIALVRHYCTPEEAGLYASAAIIGRIAFSLPSALLIVLFPTAAKDHAKGEQNSSVLLITFGITILLGATISFIFYIWPEHVITFLFGNKYQEAAPLLQKIGLSMALLASANVVFSYKLARSEFIYLWILTTASIIMLGLTLFFHETAMDIANNLILATGTAFLGALSLVLFQFKLNLNSINRKTP